MVVLLRDRWRIVSSVGSRGATETVLIKFGTPTLREGLRRIVNGFAPSAPSRLRVNKVVVDRAIRERY
jgi:hypothetical protein